MEMSCIALWAAVQHKAWCSCTASPHLIAHVQDVIFFVGEGREFEGKLTDLFFSKPLFPSSKNMSGRDNSSDAKRGMKRSPRGPGGPL